MVQRLKDYIQEPDLPEIYLDMDETIVDWYEGANSALKKFGYPEWNHEFWKQYQNDEADDIKWSVINKIPNFWLNLKFTKDGKRIWDFVKKYKPHILSACTGHSPTCKSEKQKWLSRNLGLNNLSNVHLVKRSEKRLFAVGKNGKPNLLIDDYDKNCNEFRSAGGIAIQVTTASDVISKLQKLGFK